MVSRLFAGMCFFMAKIFKNAFLGDSIGRLTIINIEESIGGNFRLKKTANCLCNCGNIISIPLWEFGNKRSCGCLKREKAHGLSHTKIWGAWQGMKARCYSESNPKYKSYGGRGIWVCSGLLVFKNFCDIMGEPPTKTHSNDRINNNSGYTCGVCDDCVKNGWELNVHWATPKEQSQNQRTNHTVVYNGKEMCLVEASRIAGVSYKAVFARMSRGWSFDKAVNTPIDFKKSSKKHKNDTTK